ncbi:MAG: 3-hydroxyacyl-(acyl-carrier-protein) dehydratase FabZ [bacterium ADurb.Bin363]|nr:MAG: 3-hydroxyacyl-(acyl-carrier-protein) dehydratase FabZ [bacterium ADurb.Bin363]
MMDINEIKKILPHRYPFLLVDRVLDLEPQKRIVAIKNVTANELFFTGHFPDQPIMPGVLITEALAQVGCIMMYANNDQVTGKIPLLMGLNNFKFRKPVIPGDQIVMEVEVLKIRRGFGKIKCCAKVENNVVAEGEITFGLSSGLDG